MEKTIVVKVGSSVIADPEKGLKFDVIEKLIAQIVKLGDSGFKPVLVSSGAIAAGFSALGFKEKPALLVDKQASASLGQLYLMQAYFNAAVRHNLRVGQMLLSREDFKRRECYINARNTMQALVKNAALPIINENDSVATEELTFGDNDMLSALVASLLHADMLIIISDIEGVFDKDPREHEDAVLMSTIESISEQLLDGVSAYSSSVGTGGMKAKLFAARLAQSIGIPVYIGNAYGDLMNIILKAAKGSYIQSSAVSKASRQKQWIAFHSEVKGSVTVDAGAKKVLLAGGRSLLSIGTLRADGDFLSEDTIAILDEDGNVLGKGKVNFSRDEVSSVCGQASQKMKALLATNRDEIIHCDNMFLYM